jgi:hypothetical protein
VKGKFVMLSVLVSIANIVSENHLDAINQSRKFKIISYSERM